MLLYRPYDLVVYYEGHFMTCLKYQYVGPLYKKFSRIDVANLSMRDIRDMVSDVVNDDDRLYFAEDGVTPDHGFKLLLTDSDVLELVNASKMTGVCKIHVFHSYSKVDPPNVEEEAENNLFVEEEGATDNVDEGNMGEGLENRSEMGEGENVDEGDRSEGLENWDEMGVYAYEGAWETMHM